MAQVPVEVVQPINRCSIIAYPFTTPECDRLNKNVQGVIELFIPASMYDSKPLGLLPVGTNDSSKNYRLLINLFGYMAIATEGMRMRPDPLNDKKQIDSKSGKNVTVTWECVPGINTPNTYVGYRLRITQHTQSGFEVDRGMPCELQELLDATASISVKTLKRLVKLPKPDARQLDIHAVDMCAWQRLCRFYDPKYFRRHDARTMHMHREENVNLENSAYNPTHAFTINRSLDLARAAGADPRYCDAARYLVFTDDTTNRVNFCGFAYGLDVYRISKSDIDPQTTHLRIMPQWKSSTKMHAVARENFVKLHGEDCRDFFDRHCLSTNNVEQANDMDGLEKYAIGERNEIRRLYPTVDGVESREYLTAIDAKLVELNTTMSEIISPTGETAPAVQAIASWRDVYLAANDNNLCLRRFQTMDNLTSFMDFWVQHMAVLKSINTVVSSFKLCTVLLLSALYVFRRVDDRPHQLLLGLPSGGKSYAVKQLRYWLIPLTWRLLANITPKAFQVPGRVNDSLILILEDCPSSLLGINAQLGTSATVATTDAENATKQMMTSQHVSTTTVEMHNGRKSVTHVADACSIIMACSNDSLKTIPVAFQSRMNVTMVLDRPESVDAPTKLDLIDRSNTTFVKQAVKTVGMMWNLMQVHMVNTLYRISAMMLPDVEMFVPRVMYGLVSAHYKKSRCNSTMDDVRKFSRFRAMITSLVCINANNLVFNSPLSPLRGKPHVATDYQLLAKHLVATKEVTVFALGLMENEFQNTIGNSCVGTLASVLFPRAIDKQKRNQRPFDPSATENKVMPVAMLNGAYVPLFANAQIDPNDPASHDPGAILQKKLQAREKLIDSLHNWDSDSCTVGSKVLPAIPSFKLGAPTIQELAIHLTNIILPHMTPRPLHTEIVQEITQMMQKAVTETREVLQADGTTVTETKQSTVIQWDHAKSCIRLSLSVLARSTESNPFYNCVSEVCDAMLNSGADEGLFSGATSTMYLFGDTEAATPSVFKTIKSEKRDDFVKGLIPMRRWDANFQSEGTKRLARDSLNGVVSMDDDAQIDSLDEIFCGQTAYVDLDGDVDKYAIQLHMDRLGLSTEDQHAMPSNDITITEPQLKAIHRLRKRQMGLGGISYPDCMIERNHAAFMADIEQRKGLDPQRYSLSAITQKKVEAQQNRETRPAIAPASGLQRQQSSTRFVPCGSAPSGIALEARANMRTPTPAMVSRVASPVVVQAPVEVDPELLAAQLSANQENMLDFDFDMESGDNEEAADNEAAGSAIVMDDEE